MDLPSNLGHVPWVHILDCLSDLIPIHDTFHGVILG
jgi:hypothetical protein